MHKDYTVKYSKKIMELGDWFNKEMVSFARERQVC